MNTFHNATPCSTFNHTKKLARFLSLSLAISNSSSWKVLVTSQRSCSRRRKQKQRSLNNCNALKKWSRRIISTSMCLSSFFAFYPEMICLLWPLLASRFLRASLRGSIARYHIRSGKQRDILLWVWTVMDTLYKPLLDGSEGNLVAIRLCTRPPSSWSPRSQYRCMKGSFFG